jgi:hypothetical protein
VVMLLGIILPNVGTFLLTALPLPGFIDQNWVRLAMLIGALATPLLVGIGGLFVAIDGAFARWDRAHHHESSGRSGSPDASRPQQPSDRIAVPAADG